jgi:large subunit ribosomal protein L10
MRERISCPRLMAPAGLISIIDKSIENFWGRERAPLAKAGGYVERIQRKKKMKRNEKSSLISKVQESLANASGIFVVENRGLTVSETEELRDILRPMVSLFKVVKNRLMKRALDGTAFAPVSELMRRPTAIALANDPYGAAKALADFADGHPNLSIVGGQMDAGLMNQADVIAIAKLPSMLEIRSTIARILIEPASRLARVSAEYGNK